MPDACLTFLNGFLLVLVFLLFPTGHFVPQWIRWTLVVFLVGDSTFFLPDTPILPNVPVSQAGWLVVVGEFTTVAAAQLYRYRRVSSPRERQQTKWVVFGLAVPITTYMLLTVLNLFFPLLIERSPLYLLASNEAIFTLMLFLPLSFGVAILRSRLWDIDTLINKALVYGLLTALLSALYAGLIIGLQALVSSLTGQTAEYPLVTVVSTLAIAALFLPLRRRIQALIDRRFYRRKYDAQKTLAAFSAALRNEVDLSQVQERLLSVVQETMQPAHVSLWLRQLERHPPEQVSPWEVHGTGAGNGNAG